MTMRIVTSLAHSSLSFFFFPAVPLVLAWCPQLVCLLAYCMSCFGVFVTPASSDASFFTFSHTTVLYTYIYIYIHEPDRVCLLQLQIFVGRRSLFLRSLSSSSGSTAPRRYCTAGYMPQQSLALFDSTLLKKRKKKREQEEKKRFGLRRQELSS